MIKKKTLSNFDTFQQHNHLIIKFIQFENEIANLNFFPQCQVIQVKYEEGIIMENSNNV